jgi:hypothetical protein
MTNQAISNGAPTPQPWEKFADVLLQREAVLCRIVAGVPPRDFAGLYVTHEDVNALLRSLPGLDGPEQRETAHVYEQFAEPLEAARALLSNWMSAADEPFARAARVARLSQDDVEVLAVLCAVEMHPQRQRLVAYIQDSVQLPRVTLATLDRIFGPGHSGSRAVAPQAALLRCELVIVEMSAPWAVRMCSVVPRLAWALHGDDSPDPDLPPGAQRLPPFEPVERSVPSASTAANSGTPAQLLLVHGADGDSRLLTVRRQHSRRGTLVSPMPALQQQWAALVREATIADLTIVVKVSDPLPAEAAGRMTAADHVRWALSSRNELPLDALPRCSWTEVEVTDALVDADDWAAHFGSGSPPGGIRLSREQLRHVAAACGGDDRRFAAGLRRLAGGHLESLAVRIRPRRSWDDLVLPSDQTRQLQELAGRHRGREVVYGRWGFPPLPSQGVVALFAGPSGTGKTLAAEVIAADLGLDLYRVDLSAVVSKWVGETEKNLSRIFDAAEAGDLVMFFDEADALFGKRSEVSDAHDRYANIEVAYLLQRLETYDGLVVMATNLQRNMDPAFLRRISVAVQFSQPDEEQRAAIWRRAFPSATPVADLDIGFLAHNFKVTGGVIANAARTAAFLAAGAGGPITMDHVALALKREFQKLGRMRTEEEFGHYYGLVSASP